MRWGNKKNIHMWWCKKENKIKNRKKGENIGTHVACPFAACRNLLSQTYTPKPDTTQWNSKECCVTTGSHVHAEKAITFSENNGRRRWYLRFFNYFYTLLYVLFTQTVRLPKQINCKVIASWFMTRNLFIDRQNEPIF